MRFIFKTSYDQDIRLVQHGGHVFWYGLLLIALVSMPMLAPEYYLSQLSFVCIYALIGVGLMLLTGYTGQVSLGHAAFLAVGAYTEAALQAQGLPFGVSLVAAAALAGLAGIVIGLPALRLTGIYLVIATIAFGFIVQEVVTRWESVTRGNSGMALKSISVAGLTIDAEWKFYYLVLFVLVLVVVGILNLLRSPTGRAFVAIRDSEISAQSMGIHLARYKTTAFALSAAITGLAGALYAHKLVFISPEQFGILLSIEFAMMIFIGGVGSLHGAVYGAIFIIALPQLIAVTKDYLPPAIGHQTGLEPTIFGLIMVLIILFEPMGLYGRWLKVRHYLQTFPLYKKDSFRRQKTFMKSERLR
jgi:branched-chain amino acid transport system permease protein